MNEKKMIRMARNALKNDFEQNNIWPGLRCACGEWGATDLGHIAYTRHPDRVELYDELNCCMLHNKCNTTGESMWINVNAGLILLQRAGGPEPWMKWARELPRKGNFYLTGKMHTAIALWEKGIRPFEIEKIKEAIKLKMERGEA